MRKKKCTHKKMPFISHKILETENIGKMGDSSYKKKMESLKHMDF